MGTNGSVTWQDVTAFVAAVASVLASLLLFAQFYIDQRRSVAAGVPPPSSILAATFSGELESAPAQ